MSDFGVLVKIEVKLEAKQKLNWSVNLCYMCVFVKLSQLHNIVALETFQTRYEIWNKKK